jgi:hypothetical protein
MVDNLYIVKGAVISHVLQTFIKNCEISFTSGRPSCVTEDTLAFLYQHVVMKLRVTTINVRSTEECLSLNVTGL